jgi:hypothetical protein
MRKINKFNVSCIVGKPAIATTYAWRSDASDKVYQTLQYDNGALSCDCMGWTRRVAADGSRSCKHTRNVQMGLTQGCLSVVVNSKPGRPRLAGAVVEASTTSDERKFDFGGDE